MTREPSLTDVPSLAEQAEMLRGAPWRRIAVLGDSIAEGVREAYPGYRDLSWTDRIVEALEAVAPGVAELNLGVRNLLAATVRERQLGPALAFEPDLAIVAAGGNDALRPTFEPSEVEAELDAMVSALRAAGADVLMIQLLNIVASGLIPEEYAPALDERLGSLAAVTRTVAERHGALVVDMRSHPASADVDVFSSDRLHLNARGHAIVAGETARVLAAAVAARSAAA